MDVMRVMDTDVWAVRRAGDESVGHGERER